MNRRDVTAFFIIAVTLSVFFAHKAEHQFARESRINQESMHHG